MGVPGRMEEIKLGQPFRAIVDFAHTPNALEQVLSTLKSPSTPLRTNTINTGVWLCRTKGS